MGDRTGIEWTDATWNPVRGCTRVSEGCRFCYAERIAARFSGPGKPYAGLARMTASGPRWTGKARLIKKHLEDPIRWRRPRRVFVNSMSDLFFERIPVDWIQSILDVMLQSPQHSFQVLTKRERRMSEVVPRLRLQDGRLWKDDPPSHIWLGVSVENQEMADRRIPVLARTPAAIRFLSVEPLIAPVKLRGLLNGIHWVIVGAESGPGARPMQMDWVRAVRDECVAAGLAFFFKQAVQNKRMVGLPFLDSRKWNQYPKQEACRA